MPRFRAILQLTDLSGSDPAHVRESVEESLNKAGLSHWRVLSIEDQAKVSPSFRRFRPLHGVRDVERRTSVATCSSSPWPGPSGSSGPCSN